MHCLLAISHLAVPQTCHNTADVVPLYLPQQLYLKPIARLTISIQLPNVKKLGKSISHWEMMEKLREIIRPDEFTILKVTKTTVEFVRFEAEVEHKNQLEKVISKLDNRTLKLKDIPDLLRIRSAVAKSEFPTRNAWDTFFQEAKDMNEMKPGERPDTVHISHLPIKWFVSYKHQVTATDDLLPSERIFHKIFEKFGHIRYVDIPKCDPYRSKMKDGISGLRTIPFEDKDFFEGYVQFKDYIGFNKAMDYLRGMKLMHKEDEEALTVNIKVDFDRSKHLSDASIRRREIVRERLIKKQRDKEEKEEEEFEEKKRKEESERQKQVDIKLQKQQRRRIREEKRKAKILEKLKISGADEINEKIAKEEKKLLKVQRKLEAIRLVEELFRRIINEKFKDGNKSTSYSDRNRHGYDELQRFKNTSELEVLNQREVLHHAIKGRVMLKTMLSGASKRKQSSSDSEDSERSKKEKIQNNQMNAAPPQIYDPAWYGYAYHTVPPPMYPVRGHPAMMPSYIPYNPRPRGLYKNPFAGPSRGFRSRGFNPRYRGKFNNFRNNTYPPDLEEEYMKYFSKFVHEHDIRENRARSRSRSRSGSYSSRRSRSRRRSYSRSRSRSATKTRSRYHSRSRSNSHSRSRSASRSKRKHSKSSRKSKSNSPSSSRRKSRSRERSKSKERSKSRGRSKSRSRRSSERSKSKSKVRSRSKSVDSAKFISPNRMRSARSKSWSMPRSSEREDKRWSKSP